MTGADEMCNFYIMYWADTHKGILDQKYCFTKGPPDYYWFAQGRLANIPADA